MRISDWSSDVCSSDLETKGSLVWANDGRTLFYVTLDEEHRPSKVFRHRLGDDSAGDALVYEEPDPGFFVDLGKTESDRYIVISAPDHTTSELRVIDAAAPDRKSTRLNSSH